MLELCDLAYVMQVEQLERLALAERSALLSRGSLKFEEVPTVQDYRTAFDASLLVEVAEVDPLHRARLEALGLM